MKKNISAKMTALICVAVLSLSTLLTGCGSSRIPAGYYELSCVEEGDTTVKSKHLDDYGLDNSCLVVDGTGEAVFVMMLSTYEGTVNKGKKVIETDFGDIGYSVDGDDVILADENITLTFTRSE